MNVEDQIQACLYAIYDFLQYDEAEILVQLQHRMALVDIWAPCQGEHILEIGCGHGETTVALASAIGSSGRVLAIDSASGAYGAPVTIAKAHAYITSSALGKRIDFFSSTDLLVAQHNFPEDTFALAVFAHSAWYMSSPDTLYQLFARIRPWARHLGYAEWDVCLSHCQQLPHLLAVCLQAYVHRLAPYTSTANIRSVILPATARALAMQAGWTIQKEQRLNTSIPLGYGRTWDIQQALAMTEQYLAAHPQRVAAKARRVLLDGTKLLRRIADKRRNMSLSTYAFLAE